jgi:raffinose/stachyose/melibiose transport system permease protein
MKERTSKRWSTVVKYIVLIVLSLIWVIPIITLILTAIKTKQDFFSGTLLSLPKKIAWSNFTNAMTKGRMFRYMKNDLIISLLKVPLGIFISSMVSFALTRLQLKHRVGWLMFFLLGMMIPMQIALVPISIVYNKLHLINTYFGLFYVYIGFGISFMVLITQGFMKSIPKAIDEAAYIDGASKWQIFTRVILPISKPALATLFITDFLSTWNEYLLASVIINDNALKTVPVGLMTFVGEHGTDYGYLFAGVLVSVIPVMAVYLIFQNYFVEGMAGAVK